MPHLFISLVNPVKFLRLNMHFCEYIGIGTGGGRASQYFTLETLILHRRLLHPSCTYVVAANYVDETNVLTRLCKSTSSIGCVCGERWGTYKAMYFWHRLFWRRRWYIRRVQHW